MITLNDIIYFAMTDRFCDGNPNNNQQVDLQNSRAYHGGDFDGLISKIPYFQKLGITALWITPVYLNIHDLGNSAGYHGYWTIDFEKIDPHLYTHDPALEDGNKAHLKKLVDQFHNAGIKIILDMVVNHTGYHTQSYNDYPDKFFNETHFNHGEGSVEGELAGLPDLDHDQVDVADYFIQNILRWIEETGIDGIRMDTVKHVENKFWYLFKSQIKTKHPDITLIGEVLDWDINYISTYQKNHDFDSIFDFPLCGCIKGTLVWDQPMTNLARPRLNDREPKGILDLDKAYTNANRLITLLDNHDLDRRIMSEVLDRVNHWDKNLAKEILKLTFTFLMTTRGIPQIYYGTEIGMTGYKDPDNRKDMPWQEFDATLSPRDPYTKDIFNHLVQLISFRKNNPAITYGYLFTLYADQFIYAYLREHQRNIVIVVINNGLGAMQIPLIIHLQNNNNIPKRIKNLLSDGTSLNSQFPANPDLVVQNGDIEVLLGRKTAGLYST